MKSLDSISLFVGTGKCNADCSHCAGGIHRKYAPKQDGIIDEKLFYDILASCYAHGARALSLSSGGEPTLSPLAVTKVLEMTNEFRKNRIEYSPINLYSNGIRIGEDLRFSNHYLPLWKKLGLTRLYITVHNINKKKNAQVYNVKKYPPLETILSRIHKADLLMRANLVLSKGIIYTFEDFTSTVQYLKDIGVDAVSAWSIRDADDNLDHELAPPTTELDKMTEWVKQNQDEKCKVILLRESHMEVYEKKQKLTLFPNGLLSNKWCG